MSERVREDDARVAERLAQELAASRGRKTSWRYVTTLLDLFGMSSLTAANRERLQAALQSAGLNPDPPLTTVDRSGHVRFPVAAKPDQARPPSVFISYRRQDSQSQANGLHDGLVWRLTGARVFMDIDSIPPGVDFVEHIKEAIASHDVVLVLIGDDWLTLTDHAGRRRIEAPEDYVRLEIETALERGTPIVPVLVEGAVMPRSDELPPSIRRLARISAFPLEDARWRQDLDRLADVIRAAVERRGAAARAEVDPPQPRTAVDVPSRVTAAWLRNHVPEMSAPELDALSDVLRRRGWSEGELIDLVYCYAPESARPRREHPPPSTDFVAPKRITVPWLREHAPGLSEGERSALVETLRGRGWSEGEIEDTVFRQRR